MAYEYDEQARSEAAERALHEHQLAELSALVQQKRRQLGYEGVRIHEVRYDHTSWAGLLPGSLAERDVVTRGDVFDRVK